MRRKRDPPMEEDDCTPPPALIRVNCGHIIKERKTLNICFDYFLKHLSEKEEILILDGIS